MEPFAKEGLDLLGGESVGDRPQASRVLTGNEAVIESLETDAGLPQLALGTLMAVETESGVRGE